MASSSQQISLDIKEISASTIKSLELLPPLSDNCSIYEVPSSTKLSKEKFYTPQMVSIGPIHCENEKLRANQHLKERYLAEFLQHTGVSLEECYELIIRSEKRLRDCYALSVTLDSMSFVRMVMVDSAFLIMIFVYNEFRTLLSSTHGLFRKQKMMYGIRYDMILLENQLPFFILEDLYKLSKLQSFLESEFRPDFDEKTAMIVLACYFFRNSLSPKFPERKPPSNAEHILELFRNCLIPADWVPERKNSATRIPSMKELHQSGVKIQVGSSENMFDVKYHDGILKVPPLKFYAATELVLRNMLAFELLSRTKEHIVSDYLEFMRMITISPADAELLQRFGVIETSIRDAELSELFKNIASDNIFHSNNFQYSDVMEGLNEYYREDWHKWKATLKEKYFRAPWAICSVFAAVFLLLLTIVQTVFTILQVVLQNK